MLGEYLDEFIIAYLNNIIIYSQSEREHFKYIKWVLQRLTKEKMPIAIKKYKFYIKKTDFCGFIIKPKNFNIDLKKVKVIVNWKDPTNITNLKSFLGFYNYY